MLTGGCLCGGARFAIDGPVTPIQLCHARRCRKATGAGFAPEVSVRTEDFRWLQGEELLAVYQAPLLHEPPAYRRGFCRVCGSPLPVVDPREPFVAFLAGILDDDPNSRPCRHVFTAQAAEWHAISDGLPRFEAEAPPDQRPSPPRPAPRSLPPGLSRSSCRPAPIRSSIASSSRG